MPSVFDQGVFVVVRKIPPGRVMTYGAIGSLLPAPGGVSAAAFRRIRARWVGYALARAPDDIPWQRVVGGTGRISPAWLEASNGSGPCSAAKVCAPTPSGRVDLDRYAWSPSRAWLTRNGFVPVPPLRSRPHGG